MAFDHEKASAESIQKFLETTATPVEAGDAGRIRTRLAQLVLSNPDDAHKTAKSLVSRVSDDPEAQAWAYRSLGDSLLYLGRFDEARSAYEFATSAADQAGRPDLAGQVLVSLFGVLSQQGNDESARTLAVRAEQLLIEANDLAQLARLHTSLGNAAHHRQDYTAAYGSYVQALSEFDELGAEDPMRVAVQINLGSTCTELLRIAEARKVFSEAVEQSVELGLDLFAAQGRFNLAVLESLRGNYIKAMSLLESAEETFRRESADEHLAATQLTRAETYIEVGMADEAVALAEDAARTYRKSGLELDAALSELAQARALRSEGRQAESRELFDSVRRFYEQHGLRGGAAMALLEAAIGFKDAPERIDAAREAAASFESLHFSESLRKARFLIAESLLELGKVAEAGSELTQVAAALETATSQHRIDFWRTRARLHSQAGERLSALKTCLRAVRDTEEEILLLPGAELRLRSSSRESVHRQFLNLLADDRHASPQSLFRTIERVHGLRARKELRTGDDWEHRREALASQLRQLQKRESEAVASEQGLLDDPDTTDLRNEVSRLENEILSQVRASSLRRNDTERAKPSSAQSRKENAGNQRLETDGTEARHPKNAADLAATASRLRDDQALILYALVDSGLVALVVKKGRAAAHRLPLSASDFERPIRRWQTQLEAFALTTEVPNLGFLRAAADNALSNWARQLLEPLVADLRDVEELIVVPQGLLHRIPFESLRLDDEYVGERWRIRRAPSAANTTLGDAGGTNPSEPDLVLATVDAGPPGALPESKLDAFRKARRIEDPSASEVLSGLRQSRAAHWITHGVFREENPLFSRFATSDGALFAADLQREKLPLSRLVLSACESGRVASGRSDDLAGVVLSFLEAGVKTVVASHWRVHDEATIQLMECFYEELRHHGEAEAMRRAAARTRQDWDHPFYWAAFGVYG